MFNIGISELIIILLVAVVVVGPNDLPKIARALGRGIKKIKLVSEDLKQAINIEDDVNELKEIKSSINQEISDLNPVSDLQGNVTEISKTVKAVKKDVEKVTKKIK